nr:hypothetical protein [uncultured Desulfobulbus sp.]
MSNFAGLAICKNEGIFLQALTVNHLHEVTHGQTPESPPQFTPALQPFYSCPSPSPGQARSLMSLAEILLKQ